MRKIFLIEDNPTEGFLLRIALSKVQDCELKHFSTGQAMLDKLEEEPDVCIVDLNLPDISGMELMEIIKEALPNCKIIVVSAERNPEVIVKIQGQFTPYYLIKSDACLKALKMLIDDIL
jgi:DNA-binding NarL/FixJ family response regulator